MTLDLDLLINTLAMIGGRLAPFVQDTEVSRSNPGLGMPKNTK